ncbi:MAG: glycosyl transferase family 90 [Dolichospermum sp.]
MKTEHELENILSQPEITDPSSSTYFTKAFPNELLCPTDSKLLFWIDEHLIKYKYFSIPEHGQDLPDNYPYFNNLKEIRIIPAIDALLDRQITQFVKVEKNGSFSFFITQVEEGHKYPFLLDEELKVDQTTVLILPRIIPLVMIFDEFVQKYPGKSGIAPFFYGDKGRGEGSVLCYDSNCDHHLRIPDSYFLEKYAYQDFKNQLATESIPWNERQGIVYWRGSSTGDKENDHQWRMMPRFRLCQLAIELANKDLFDLKITRITNRFSSEEVIAEIKNSGLTATYTAAIDQVKYKYLIDIDGHSSAWPGLFLRLLTGSTVLKVNSERGFRQWFHNRLIPWENHVPIEPDFSNLEETVLYLKSHDELARKIGEAGRELAYSMTMENEINCALPVILRCLEDNRDLLGIF